uniref:Ubiquitin-like domain-containing protein n=1 Tax=Macrostomum lignano TaxID=282301 RepID=A0A1I8H4R6_9PLAT
LPRAMSEDHTTVAEMQPQTSICADGDEAAPEGSSPTQEAAEEAAAEPEVEADADSPPVSLKVIFNKRKIDLTLPVSAKVISLKRQLQELTGVPVDMQKLMFRGLCHDDRRLSELGVGDGAKLMLVGSTPDSLASVRRQDAAGEAADRDLHRRVLDKYGRPDDLTPGILNANLPLPPAPLSGMYNRQGAKVRLTFKLEIDQLWIGTKERTNKIPMSSIKRIVSEPIEGQEAHHIVGLQLGTTEQSMYWLYWVPCQYVRAIQTTIGT